MSAATTGRVSLFERLSFGCGDTGCVFIWTVIGSFYTIYLTDHVQIAASAVAAIMLSVRIMDGFSDLVMGYILDRTNSKLGKARPWILWTAPFMALFLILCFAVPEFLGPTGRIIYAFFTYFMLTVVVYTACNLSYCALTSFITDNLEDRASMNSIRFFMTGTLTLILGYVTPVAAQSLGWRGITIVYGLIALALLLICFFFCKERVAPQKRAEGEKIGAIDSLKILGRNDFFYFLVAFFALDFSILGLTGSGGMYLARYNFSDDALFGNINMALTLPQIIAALLVPAILKHVRGKWTLLQIGYVLFVAGYAISGLFLQGNVIEPNTTPYFGILGGYAIAGFGRGLHFVALFAMIADVVEYGEWKTGKRLEGITYSVSSFGFKVGMGLGGAVVGTILSMVDYDASLELQPDSTLNAIVNMNIWVPVALSAAGLIISLTRNLDKVYPTIMKELTARRALEEA